MKKFALLLVPFSFLFFSFTENGPLKKEQLMQPSELAAKLNDPKSVKPVIFNVGPVDQIRTAINIGAVNSDEGMAKLKKALAGIDKNKEIVVYCGCCSSSNCPNIRPAISYLAEAGFKKAKVLDIPTGIKEDWVQKGYPVEKAQ